MEPFVGNIETLTERNNNFRKVLFTGKNMQLVVMSLKPKEEIGVEVHDDVDQFFRVEQGTARFVLGDNTRRVTEGGAVVVPAGTRHNVINPSATEPLRLYTIYTPPEHPANTVHKTKAEADAAEHH
jgi:mannose-6-phosphate isomerase-like protein (cupin superfamily)